MNELKKLKSSKKGITLISLVVTIIVLLILVGVTIATLTGDNGILTQAQRAKKETEDAKRQEEENLAELEAIVNGQDIAITPVHDDNPGQLEQEESDTLVINSIEDLVFFSYDVTHGNSYSGKTVKLGSNLDFNSDKSYVNPNRTDFVKYGYNGSLKQALTSGTGFNPIGELSPTGTKYFNGTFDGNNKAICSLYMNINNNDSVRVGLFSVTYGEIKNLGLANINISVKGVSTVVGGITARTNNNISNSYVSGSINVIGNYWMPVGGLCGVSFGSSNIENCYNLSIINCTNNKEEYGEANITLGGIVGQTEGGEVNINRCFNKGNLTVDGGNNVIIVGGICGRVNNTSTINVINSYNNSKITVETLKGDSYIAGITAQMQSTSNIINCYNSGEIVEKGTTTESKDYKIGGIIANLPKNSEVTNVFNTGNIKVQTSNNYLQIGGIAGATGCSDTVKINNAYNIGKIKLENSNSQNIGSISGSMKLVTLSNCFYLAGTYNVGVGKGDSTGIIELQSISDFPSVLNVVNSGNESAFVEDTNNANDGYPILNWQYEQTIEN